MPIAKLNPITLVGEAWSTVRAKKSLWWIGVLAGLGQGYGMNSELVDLDQRLASNNFVDSVRQFSFGQSVLLLFVVCLLVGLWIVSVMAEAGLTRTIAHASSKSVSFRSGVVEGKKVLWPFLRLQIILALLSFVFVLVFLLPALASPGSGATVLASVLGTIIFLYTIILSLLYPWIARFIILKEASLVHAVKQSVALFKKGPWQFLKLGLGGILLHILGSVLIIGAALILVILLIVVASLIFPDSSGVGVAISSAVVTGMVAVALFLAGGLTALKNAYYTIAFKKLTD